MRLGAELGLITLATMPLWMPYGGNPYYGYGYGRRYRYRDPYYNPSFSSNFSNEQARIKLNKKIQEAAAVLSAKIIEKIADHKNTPQGYNVQDQLERINKFLKNYGLLTRQMTRKQAVIDSYEALGKMIDDKTKSDEVIPVTSMLNAQRKVVTGAVCLSIGVTLFGLSLAAFIAFAPTVLMALGIVAIIASIPLIATGIPYLVIGCRDKAFVKRVEDVRGFAKDPSKDHPKRLTAFERVFGRDEEAELALEEQKQKVQVAP